jgi:hypothetical protein
MGTGTSSCVCGDSTLALEINPELFSKSKKSSLALGSTIKITPNITNRNNNTLTPKPSVALASGVLLNELTLEGKDKATGKVLACSLKDEAREALKVWLDADSALNASVVA